MRYDNFDIKIISTGGESYFVTANSGSGETAEGELSLTGLLTEWPKRFSDGATRREQLKDFGAQLFDLLFKDRVGILYEKSYDATEKGDKAHLRVRLCIEPQKISVVPWECLYERRWERFLSASPETPLVRYFECEEPIRKLKVDLPLKVLVIVPEASRPRQGGRTAIMRAFRELNPEVPIEFTLFEGEATQDAIRSKLSREYHVLHFVTSGGCNREGDYVLLDGAYGVDEQVAAAPLSQLVKQCKSLKLVVLDCHAADSHSDLPTLAGVVPHLITSGLPAAIALQFPMGQQASLAFAKEFYRLIGTGNEPGRVDTAVAQARQRVFENHSDSADFAAPVLFTRAPEGVIFYFDRKKLPLFSRARLASVVKKIRPFARRTPARATRLRLLKDIRETHLRNILLLKPRAEAADDATKKTLENLIKEEKASVIELEDKLWPWGKTLLFAFVFSLLVGFASEVNALNKFRDLDDYLTHWLMDYANERRKPEIDKERVAVVMVGESHSEDVDKVTATRKQLADLLPILRDSGARVVAFDVGFFHPSPEGDKKLAEAIGEIDRGNSGLRVLSSIEDVREDGSPVNSPPEPLPSALMGKYGLVELNEPPIGKGGQHYVARKAALGSYVGAQAPDDSQQEIPLYPSLALRALIEWASLSSSSKNVFYNIDEGHIRVGNEVPRDEDMRIPATNPLDDKAEFEGGRKKYRAFAYIHYVVKRSVGGVEKKYSVVDGRRNDSAALKDWFKDHIVLVTLPDNDKKDDTFNVPAGDERRGAAILANVISNLLNRHYIQRLSWFYRYLLIVLMVAAGLFLQVRFARTLRQKVALKLPLLIEPVQIPIILAVVAVIYLVIAESLYEHQLLVFDITYPLLALVMSYGALGLARKAVISKWS